MTESGKDRAAEKPSAGMNKTAEEMLADLESYENFGATVTPLELGVFWHGPDGVAHIPAVAELYEELGVNPADFQHVEEEFAPEDRELSDEILSVEILAVDIPDRPGRRIVEQRIHGGNKYRTTIAFDKS